MTDSSSEHDRPSPDGPSSETASDVASRRVDDAAAGRDGPVPATGQPVTFSLASLFLVLTLAAVVCALLAAAPGLGVLVGILAVPALVRTAVYAKRRHVEGPPLTWTERCVDFCASFGVTCLLAFSGSLAFAATCIPLGFMMLGLGNEGDAVMLAVLAGFAVAIIVVTAFGKQIWPRNTNHDPPQ